MDPTRRDFLRLGLGASTLLGYSATVPSFLEQSAHALARISESTKAGRVLVVLQLDGGNDGLNTVVPYTDAEYHKQRRQLHLTKDQVLKIDDRLGFHRSLRGLAQLLEAGQLSIVQSVGY